MFNKLFSQFWAIHSPFQATLETMIQRAITAGPVDDAARYGLPVRKVNGTALISTVGPIVKEAGWLSFWGFAGTREAQASLLSADADPDIENIVWLMDTPGGSTDGLEELAQVVSGLKKPVTVFVDGLIASAGYYVGSQADAIYAAPRSLIGSIGTRMMLVDTSKYYADKGIKFIPIDTGEHKSAGADGVEITESQIKEFQRIVDGFNQYFINAVSKGRKLPKETVKEYADGRVFFAEEAIDMGLIDGVTTLSSILSAKKSVKNESGRKIRQAKLALLNLKTSC